MPMVAFAAVLGAFGLFVAVAPLLGRVPVVVRPRVQAAVVVTAAVAEVLVQLLTMGRTTGWVLPAALAAVAGVALARGSVQFFGVREVAFGAALPDVVDAMEAHLRGAEAAASVGSRANYAFWAIAALAVAIVAYFP